MGQNVRKQEIKKCLPGILKVVSYFEVELFVSGVVVSRSGFLRLSLDPKPSNHKMVYTRVHATPKVTVSVSPSIRLSPLVFVLFSFLFFFLRSLNTLKVERGVFKHFIIVRMVEGPSDGPTDRLNW